MRNMKPILAPETNIGELMDYCMTISDQETADMFWEELIDWSILNWNVPSMEPSRENAEMVMRRNIGFWAGHYSGAVEERMKLLFKAVNPILEYVR